MRPWRQGRREGGRGLGWLGGHRAGGDSGYAGDRVNGGDSRVAGRDLATGRGPWKASGVRARLAWTSLSVYAWPLPPKPSGTDGLLGNGRAVEACANMISSRRVKSRPQYRDRDTSYASAKSARRTTLLCAALMTAAHNSDETDDKRAPIGVAAASKQHLPAPGEHIHGDARVWHTSAEARDKVSKIYAAGYSAAVGLTVCPAPIRRPTGPLRQRPHHTPRHGEQPTRMPATAPASALSAARDA